MTHRGGYYNKIGLLSKVLVKHFFMNWVFYEKERRDEKTEFNTRIQKSNVGGNGNVGFDDNAVFCRKFDVNPNGAGTDRNGSSCAY